MWVINGFAPSNFCKQKFNLVTLQFYELIILRKVLLGCGMLFLLIGIIVASSFNMAVERFKGREEAASIVKEDMEGKNWTEWTVSANFERGKVMVVEIEPRTGLGGWWIHFARVSSPRPYNVTITGPSRRKAIFRFFFGRADLLPGWDMPRDIPMKEIPLTIYNITLLQKSDDLEVRFEYNFPKEVGGVVKQSGDFTVGVEPYVPWRNFPPDAITLYEEIYEVERPYGFLLPIGVVLNVFGVLMALRGAGSKRRKRRKLSRRVKK